MVDLSNGAAEGRERFAATAGGASRPSVDVTTTGQHFAWVTSEDEFS